MYCHLFRTCMSSIKASALLYYIFPWYCTCRDVSLPGSINTEKAGKAGCSALLQIGLHGTSSLVNPCFPRASPATLLTPSNLFKVCNCNSLKTPTLVWSCGDLHVLYADIFAMEGLFRLQSGNLLSHSCHAASVSLRSIGQLVSSKPSLWRVEFLPNRHIMT